MATHNKTDEKLAIKLMSGVSKEQTTELMTEAAALKDINHTSIIKIHEFASDDQYHYIISE